MKNVPQSGHQGKRPEPWTARQALAGTEAGVSRVVFSPLCCASGAVHGGEEASQIGAGRYSQVKHQEHEARRLVGIDESDWGKRQKGRDRDGKERMHIKGAFHPEATAGCYWEGKPKEAVGTQRLATL